MNAPTLWWLVAGVLVAVELATGTLYLLMLALGCVAGAVVAHAAFTPVTQVVVAALVGLGTTAGWHVKRSRAPRPEPVESNRDVSLDIGQTVHVPGWASDGSARVQYRGASWNVRFSGPGLAVPGEHVIVALQGNELRVAPSASRSMQAAERTA